MASFFLAAIGAIGLACGPAWPSVVVVGLAVVLALGLVALEAIAAVRVAGDVAARFAALEARFAATATALDKADKNAQAALDAAVRFTNGRKKAEPEF